MAYPDNLLVQGERVIVRKRPHWKVLVLPTILFVVIIGLAVALATWISKSNWQDPQWAYYAIIAVAVVALIILVLVPFVRWRTEHFVITNHHVFFRTGLLSRREHQIPLGQIANMETEVTFWGRLMGYGSLVVESSADQPLKFRNVASLSKVQATLNQLIRDERERTHRVSDRDTGGDQQYQQPQGYQQSSPQQYEPPQQGYPQQGYPQQGYPQEGYPQQGYPQQGYPPQGYPQQGSSQGGSPGYPPNGQAEPGYQSTQDYQQPPGYQPTQAYQQPPGYPPSSAQPGYSTPGQEAPTSAGPAPSEQSRSTEQSGSTPQSGSAYGDGGSTRS